MLQSLKNNADGVEFIMPKMPIWKIILLVVAVFVVIAVVAGISQGESSDALGGIIVFFAIAGIGLYFLKKKKGKESGENDRNFSFHLGGYTDPMEEVVGKTSEKLALEKQLNAGVKYFYEVERLYGKDISCSSRAGFEKLDVFDCLQEWVEDNYDNLSDLLSKVKHNIRERARYDVELDKLRSKDYEGKGWSSELGIPFERYCRVERTMFEKNELSLPNDFELEITKEYVSPAGTKSIKQSASFELEEIETALEKESIRRKPLEEQHASERIHRNLASFYTQNIHQGNEGAVVYSFPPDMVEKFKRGDEKAIEETIMSVIEGVKWPLQFERGVEISFEKDARTLFIDFLLPTKECIPNIKEVKKLSSGEYEQKYYSNSSITTIYETFVYQSILVILQKAFKSTEGQGWTKDLESIAFNGRVKSVDKSTGKSICPYILSVFVSRDSFNSLVLDALDPKAWFRGAKGISASSLADIVPITPSVRMNKKDSRFVDGYSVIDEMDDSVNLAAMDWQDFENLIRELFEQEFQGPGGEVKITQASRDGGVDAIAFDPDPIRGGKIVIQAKRYTKVVDVAAVRDLYGTVINEGATKGILVTTANYGSDSYKFAQGKPLTLLNGANLLSLLEKHGHKARINIQEARETLGLSGKSEIS